MLDVQQGATALAGAGQIPAGEYRSIRLVIDTDSSSITSRYGRSEPINWPVRGELTLYSLVEAPVVVGSGGTDIVVDFDVGRSFQQTSYGLPFTYLPVVRAVNRAATGSLSGTVTTDSTQLQKVKDASVAVYRGDPTQADGTWSLAATGRTDAQGRFLIAFLMPRSYIVRVTPPGAFYQFGTATRANLMVSAGADTAISVTLPPRDQSSLGVSFPSNPIAVGQTAYARAFPRDASGQLVTVDSAVSWSSSNNAIVTVATMGVKDVPIRGVSAGQALITARYGARTLIDTVVVGSPPAVDHVVIAPAWSVLMDVGDTLHLRAFPVDATGRSLPQTQTTWSIDSTLFRIEATPSPGDVIMRALANGSAVVSATLAGKSASTGIRIGPDSDTRPVASVALTPTSRTSYVGDTLWFFAAALASNGDTLSRAMHWASSDTSIVRLTPYDDPYRSMRAFRGVGRGTAIVTASSGSKSAAATVTIP
ncbi:MAG: DUF4382 domain-containing protein [Gemmatimonadaceae bacterium]